MIDKVTVLDIIQEALEGSDKFLVNLKITTDNRIFVDIDGDNGINIDDCIELSRKIENSLNRDEEDFELNVSSAGADAPLKLPRQYRKNVGRNLAVETFDGEHLEGRLCDADDNQVVLRLPKTKHQAPEEVTLEMKDIKSAHVVIQF